MRLSEIDDHNRGDHYYLTPQDECFYLLEYTSGRDFSFSQANQIISNLKKKPSERFIKGGYHYKAQVIRQASNTLREAIHPDWLQRSTLIPVPGSKCVGHLDYDDRMEQICRGIQDGLDVRNLVTQTVSTEAAHEAGINPRPTVEELIDLYQIDETLCDPAPTDIGVFDDVLTAGTHFKAMKTVLNRRFPGVRVSGFFIARRVFPTPLE
ncbi:hypothetical protein SAMN05444398_1295 [Roseovarius pacificus]|uniref:Amidophosphoribosyltransferase n=1 Tax=Roseovarius pacificus TaxID=337701 RepID=A0A1M7KIV9_9RHOB|nr:hypothetical protein [Roseovarius pacificus]GGO62819.1 hypothetical protein GCM10011315_42710 [Roseovarius pacificus]SHM65310.1 hypothetical protein SAMN05444398_1295 [Roseovarius pacificus]